MTEGPDLELRLEELGVGIARLGAAYTSVRLYAAINAAGPPQSVCAVPP